MGFLAFREFGLFAAEPAFGLGDLHAFAGAGADEVGFEFGDHGQDVEEQPADRVGRVMDGSTDAQLHFLLCQFFDDVAGVGQGAGEPVEFGDDQGVAGTDGGEGFTKTGPVPVGAGEPVVGIDPVFGHTQRGQPVPLGGEVLLVGRDAGVADDVGGHTPTVAFRLPSPGFFAGGVYANLRSQYLHGIYAGQGGVRKCRGGGPLNESVVRLGGVCAAHLAPSDPGLGCDRCAHGSGQRIIGRSIYRETIDVVGGEFIGPIHQPEAIVAGLSIGGELRIVVAPPGSNRLLPFRRESAGLVHV